MFVKEDMDIHEHGRCLQDVVAEYECAGGNIKVFSVLLTGLYELLHYYTSTY